jgi:uncharacterized protein YwgA
MKRLQRAAVLLSLVEEMGNKGSWCGETHIQKAAYFLQKLLGVPLGHDFILYKHGPYSFDLADEITGLRADSILKFEIRPEPYGPSLAPDSVSSFLVDNYPKTREKYAKQVAFVAAALGTNNVAELERLATALYVTLEGHAEPDAESRAACLHELKPHVSLEDAREAVRRVDEIRKQARDLVVQ